MPNLLILIGGPGLFKSCDSGHDKTWLNYFHPIYIAVKDNLINKANDKVHWIVYEPAYKERWLEDSDITFLEGAYEAITGRELHNIRKAATDKVVAKGSKNFLEHIKKIAKNLNVTYKGITTPAGFWKYIESFPNNSISRVWYSGHATTKGLILKLTHNSDCNASWTDDTTVLVDEIDKNKMLKNRFISGSKKFSKFYGCNTSDFASTWHRTFGIPAEGAGSSITFKGIFDNRLKVLERLETTPTPQGPPKWIKFQ